jgi:hypothetical protein
MRGCKKRMKPETGNLSKAVAAVYDRRCPSLKSLIQVSALCVVALATTSCVTVGYDFLNQQATVTMTPSTKGLAK